MFHGFLRNFGRNDRSEKFSLLFDKPRVSRACLCCSDVAVEVDPATQDPDPAVLMLLGSCSYSDFYLLLCRSFSKPINQSGYGAKFRQSVGLPYRKSQPAGGGVSKCWSQLGYQRIVERPWAPGHHNLNLLKILGSEVPRSTAVLCTDSLVARPRGTEIRREGCSYAFLIV